MRDYLFHGKRKDNGEWVEGYLVKSNEKCFIYYEAPDEMCQTGNWLCFKEVIPETVGQYAGLTDKNGKKIFEGHIVKVTYTSSDGETRNETTLVKYDEIDCCFYPMRWNESCEWCDYSTEINEIEVIGNKIDNPELLKEG